MLPISRCVRDLALSFETIVPVGTSNSGDDERQSLDRLLGELLEAVHPLLDYDLATVMALEGNRLRVRATSGRLASPRVRQHSLDLDQRPEMDAVIRSGRARITRGRADRLGDDPFDGGAVFAGAHTCLMVPLLLDQKPLGIMTFNREGRFTEETVVLAEVLGRLLAVTLAFTHRTRELDRLVRFLEGENRFLDARTQLGVDARDLLTVCPSAGMREITRLARQVAPTTSPVLITGETGTGKEVLAKAIHLWSRRSGNPMVSVNCAALSRELIESELFGHVKGAFTGASRDRIGRFKAADGGTLFLDEVGELPPALQAKLLRALEEGQFEPVGSSRTDTVDVRVMAATNVDLREAVAQGRFREDLYYRLAVFPLRMAPLRERPEDVPIIARNILRELTKGTGAGYELSAEQIARLEGQSWPGNVRELANLIRRSLVVSEGHELTLALGPDHGEPGTATPGVAEKASLVTLEEMERRHIRAALEATDGKIYGEDGAAAVLAINPNTLRSRMRKLGLGGARDFRKTS